VNTQLDQQARGLAGWRVLAPFALREYRLLIAALSLSIFAEGMWTVVMALQVIHLDDDPTALSLVASCLGIGLVAFILVGGIAADRFPQRSIIIAVETVNFTAVSVVAALGATGLLQIWHMAVTAALLGSAAAFFFPAYNAYLPRILPTEQLLAAKGIEGVVRPVLQRAAGPAVAGVLVGATFPSLGLGAVALLFGIGLTLLVATRPVRQGFSTEHTGEKPHVLADLRDGFRFMVGTPWLRTTVAFASIFVLLVLGPIEVLLPFIAADRFADGARMYGLMLAAYGIGSGLGAIGVSSGRMPRRYLTVMMLVWGPGALPLALVGWTHSFAVLATAMFAVGLTDGIGMVIWGTLLQRRVARNMVGRVSSLDFFVSLAFLPLSMAIAGPLSKIVSMQTIFAVAGIAPMVLAALAWVAARMSADELAHPLR
jgi:DHA3 family tetracycline resistance protein-like MFS transporter